MASLAKSQCRELQGALIGCRARRGLAISEGWTWVQPAADSFPNSPFLWTSVSPLWRQGCWTVFSIVSHTDYGAPSAGILLCLLPTGSENSL